MSNCEKCGASEAERISFSAGSRGSDDWDSPRGSAAIVVSTILKTYEVPLCQECFLLTWKALEITASSIEVDEVQVEGL